MTPREDPSSEPSRPPEPSSGPEGPAEPPAGPEAPAGGPGGGGPGGDGGMSTGLKVALGCGGCLLVLLVGVGLAVGVGGLWISEKAGDFTEGVERQAELQTEATETLERLEREHPFEPPADGTVSPERAERFFAVTDAAWEEMEDWAGELDALQDRLGDEDPGLGDVGAVFRGYGRLAESRAVIARALEDEEMSLYEYLWTGLTLSRAHDAMEAGSAGDVPAGTREVVRQNEAAVADFTGDRDDDGIGREAVFYLAWMWGSADASTIRALGLDTLQAGG